MTRFWGRKLNRKKIKPRALLFLFLILIAVNIGHIGRCFYPFHYRELTLQYARTYNVDPLLLAAIMKAESNFDHRAVSKKGARGLMQIMPDTGTWIAGRMGAAAFNPEALFEPGTSIKFGAWYIADLRKEFRGDTILVLAAYNGGRGNVKNWFAGKELSGVLIEIKQIPFPETRHYIKKVLWYRRVYNLLYR
ncbi:MAG: Uncharacterized protein XD97_0473 [Pelotomaculum thermopropionicum]|uniref:Transglycosylase SLT domain-containing protein n=1 Tax=Pelotomaculum thermopropionicum TaxID=110500 RepID=A0A101HSN0_9FIRM|nr:MAG: Uncharacterized protein XD97_0473 [Pelotomaculum thermopropionicum]